MEFIKSCGGCGGDKEPPKEEGEKEPTPEEGDKE